MLQECSPEPTVEKTRRRKPVFAFITENEENRSGFLLKYCIAFQCIVCLNFVQHLLPAVGEFIS